MDPTLDERIDCLDARVEALADRTARGLAALAVAITEMRRPTRWQRFQAWFATWVYSDKPK